MDFAKKFKVFYELFITNGGWKRVIQVGLVNTLTIAVVGLLIGIVIGTVIATIKVMPKNNVFPKILEKVCTLYVSFFRGTPIVVQLLLAYYVLWPICGITLDGLDTSIIVFGLNSGAYVSEIMRAGILSIDPGQTEAGRSLGLSYPTTMLKIVVPQAVKNILPTLGNEFIALVKDTSVVTFVAATDMCKTFVDIGNQRYEYFAPYIVMGLFYIVLVLIISTGLKIMERWLRKSDH